MVKHSKKNRKGGDFMNNNSSSYQTTQPSTSNTSKWFTNAFDSIKNAAKKVTTSANPTSTSTYQTTTTTYPTPAPSTQYDSNASGGMRRKKRGGYKSNISLNNLAYTAAPVNGIPTAKAQAWVGGKTKKRKCSKRHKHIKSCRVRKSKRRM